MGKLERKTAIVTGSGRGIGRAIAEKLADEGTRLVVNDLDPEATAETIAGIEASGGAAVALDGDVTEPEFGDRLVEAALDAFGSLDIVVNNAGYIWHAAIHNQTDEQWYAMLDVHATAPFRLPRAAGRHFREAVKSERAEGREVCRKVVNISSVSGTVGAATQVSYAAGKMAVVGLTKALAREWGRLNVTVNAVAFGPIETRLMQTFEAEAATVEVKGRQHKVGFDAATREEVCRRVALGRFDTPEEAAGAVYLFCIPESDFITGEVVTCSGGLVQL